MIAKGFATTFLVFDVYSYSGAKNNSSIAAPSWTLKTAVIGSGVKRDEWVDPPWLDALKSARMGTPTLRLIDSFASPKPQPKPNLFRDSD